MMLATIFDALVFPTCVGVDRRSWAARRRTAVFPTCVGVDRQHAHLSSAVESIPHVRGGGPIRQVCERLPGWYSPRAWGWTVKRERCPTTSYVFPTCVGVDRAGAAAGRTRESIPHVRGGGPMAVLGIALPNWYSPRAWGWTGWVNHHLLGRSVCLSESSELSDSRNVLAIKGLSLTHSDMARNR